MATSIIRNFPLSPIVTGSLLYLLTRAPEQYREPAIEHLRQYLSPSNLGRAVTALKWLCAWGVFKNVHGFLSDLAQNNWRLRSERHRYNWPHEVAVVTGAAGGFGSLISKDLAARDVNVIAVDIAERLPEHLTAHPKIWYHRCDLTDRAAVMELRDTIAREHGEVSVLINNAGVCWQHSVLDASEEALRRVWGVNVLGNYFTIQAFLPDMIKNRKGHVVSMASVASFLSPPGLVPYSNTKAAVMSLHEGIKGEVAHLGKAPEIKFTILHPIYADTPMTESVQKEIIEAGFPLIHPQVVSDAVVNQIMACKSAQIVLAEGREILSTIRAWPHWLSGALMLALKQADIAKYGEKAMKKA